MNNMNNFDFKSQICTTQEQSARLLNLGIKKETADMIYVEVRCTDGSIEWDASPIMEGLTALDYEDNWPPAWSLGRLLELIKHSDICNYNDFGCIKLYIDLDDFETCITMISYMVKDGRFNKDYLA